MSPSEHAKARAILALSDAFFAVALAAREQPPDGASYPLTFKVPTSLKAGTIEVQAAPDEDLPDLTTVCIRISP